MLPKIVDRIEINENQFSPKLLYSNLFRSGDLKAGTKLQERYVFDYEIEFFVFSEGGMWINDEYYEVKKGDMIFRRPGDWTQAVMPYDCYCVFFDLLGDTDKIPHYYNIYGENKFQNNYSNGILDCIPVQLHPGSNEKYISLFEGILDEFINPGDCSQLMTKAYILQLLKHLYIDAKDPFSKRNLELTPNYVLIKAALEFIHENIENRMVLSQMAKVSNLSPNYFHQLFRKIMGVTPNEYIIKIRLEKAREVLVKTKLSISEVAMMCGFESISYFSYVFKRKLGLSPNEFRKKYDLYK